MAQYCIDLPKHNEQSRKFTTLHFKRTYGPGIKTANWQNYPESNPIDNNPFDPEKFNLHASHYNRLGFGEDQKWISETHAFLQQSVNPPTNIHLNFGKKDQFCFYTYEDDCQLADLHKKCPEDNDEEYLTTMQHSYRPPYPLYLERLKAPIVDNRRFGKLGTNFTESKFLDDNFICETKRLQALKMNHNLF